MWEYLFLCNFIDANKFKNILEFGPGISTLSFCETNCKIYSYESDLKWMNYFKKQFQNIPNINIFPYDIKKFRSLEEIKNIKIDMAFIDSPRYEKNKKFFNRIITSRISSRYCNCIVIHDSKRDSEKEIISYFINKNWNFHHINSIRGIGILYKNIQVKIP